MNTARDNSQGVPISQVVLKGGFTVLNVTLVDNLVKYNRS